MLNKIKYSGVCADHERKNRNDGCREERIFAQGPKAVTKVLNKIVDIWHVTIGCGSRMSSVTDDNFMPLCLARHLRSGRAFRRSQEESEVSRASGGAGWNSL